MIKGRRTPRRGGMTEGAIRREAGLSMVRIGRCIVVLLVAGIAIGGRSSILAVDMTLQTRYRRVETCQRIMRVCCVVKVRVQPIHRRVAN